jgi:hypothetical protein
LRRESTGAELARSIGKRKFAPGLRLLRVVIFDRVKRE